MYLSSWFSDAVATDVRRKTAAHKGRRLVITR